MLNGKKWQSFITSNLDHSYVLSTSKKDTPWPHGEYVCTWTYLLLTLLHRIEDYFLGHSIWDDTISLIFAPQRSGFVTLPDSERPTDRLPPKQHSLWKPRGNQPGISESFTLPLLGCLLFAKSSFPILLARGTCTVGVKLLVSRRPVPPPLTSPPSNAHCKSVNGFKT